MSDQHSSTRLSNISIRVTDELEELIVEEAQRLGITQRALLARGLKKLGYNVPAEDLHAPLRHRAYKRVPNK